MPTADIMGDTIAIRRLVGADAQAYRDFRRAALAWTPTAFGSSPEEEGRRPLASTMARLHDEARPDDFILGAFAGGRLVGTAGFRRAERAKSRHSGTLFGMAVAPDMAGQGIGRRLLTRLLAEARAIPGLLQVVLTVSEGQRAAERLYATSGFVVFGREARALIVDGADVAQSHMACRLDHPHPATAEPSAAVPTAPPSQTLVIGGARSGKSRHAEALARRTGLGRLYVATATAWDDEMRERIAEHRALRAADGWRTIEEPLRLTEALRREAAPDRILLVDCLTLWLTNVMLGAAPERARDEVAAACTTLVAAVPDLAGPAIFVSNEVGWGIVPDNRLARDFRDLQGRLNQDLAEVCGSVVLVAAGLPLMLKGRAGLS